MTILDLIRLIQRHLKLVIALPIIFGVIAVAWSSFTQTTYTATASFTSGDISFAQALASKEATSYSNQDIRVSCSSNTSTKTVTITATGPNSDACIRAANDVANGAVEQYKEMNSSILDTINEASSAQSNNSSLFKYHYYV